MGIGEIIATAVIALICYLSGPRNWKAYKQEFPKGFAQGIKDGFRK